MISYETSECSVCKDKYCMIIKKNLKTRCLFCDCVCNNIICERKHVEKFCEKRKYEREKNQI